MIAVVNLETKYFKLKYQKESFGKDSDKNLVLKK